MRSYLSVRNESSPDRLVEPDSRGVIDTGLCFRGELILTDRGSGRQSDGSAACADEASAQQRRLARPRPFHKAINRHDDQGPPFRVPEPPQSGGGERYIIPIRTAAQRIEIRFVLSGICFLKSSKGISRVEAKSFASRSTSSLVRPSTPASLGMNPVRILFPVQQVMTEFVRDSKSPPPPRLRLLMDDTPPFSGLRRHQRALEAVKFVGHRLW